MDKNDIIKILEKQLTILSEVIEQYKNNCDIEWINAATTGTANIANLLLQYKDREEQDKHLKEVVNAMLRGEKYGNR